MVMYLSKALRSQNVLLYNYMYAILALLNMIIAIAYQYIINVQNRPCKGSSL